MGPEANDPASLQAGDVAQGAIPARAVLTELARGFLLVRENDRERAVRFAATFLRERSAKLVRTEPVAYPAVPLGQRALGRFPRGAVERPDPRGPR